MPNDRSDEASAAVVISHGSADPVSGALPAPGLLFISRFEVEEQGENSLEPAGVIYDAGFGDSESDYLRLLLLMYYVQLLRERPTLTVTDASSRHGYITETDLCVAISAVPNEIGKAKKRALPSALAAIGAGVLTFAMLAQIAC